MGVGGEKGGIIGASSLTGTFRLKRPRVGPYQALR